MIKIIGVTDDPKGYNRDSIRKAREAFLIQKGRTIDHPRRNLLILLPLIMLFHYFFTLYLSLVYTVNYFYLFPLLQNMQHKNHLPM